MYISCSTKRGGRTWQSLTCHIENVFATHHSNEVQNLIRLCQVSLVLPTNTAGCERGFSAQNRIKNALRKTESREAECAHDH